MMSSITGAVTSCIIPAPAPGAYLYYKPRSKDPQELGELRRAIEKRRRQKEARARVRAKEKADRKADRKAKQSILRMRMRGLKNRLRLC